MRCPDCGIFVSYGGDYEPEIDFEEINENELRGEVRVVLDCAECGGELKELSMEYKIEIEHDCPAAATDADNEEADEEQYEIQSTYTQFTDRRQTTDRNGKPIRNPRYQRTYYGAEITTTIKCTKCGEEFDVDTKVEDMASSFEEI